MREITVKVYKFNELSDKAKEKARYWYRDITAGDSDAWEQVRGDAEMVGLVIESLDQHRPNKGHFTKGPFECAERIMLDHGAACETRKTATAFIEKFKALEKEVGRMEDGELSDMDALEKLEYGFLHDILEDYRIMMQKEVDYQDSDEAVDENIIGNEYEFTEDGKRARC